MFIRGTQNSVRWSLGHVTLKVSQPLLATVGFKTDLLLFLAEVSRIFFHNQLALTQFGDGYDIR